MTDLSVACDSLGEIAAALEESIATRGSKHNKQKRGRNNIQFSWWLSLSSLERQIPVRKTVVALNRTSLGSGDRFVGCV